MFAHFNYSQLRKYILAFGKLFSNVVVVRTQNNDGTGADVQQFKVPIDYGAKERWFVRLTQDPQLQQGVRVVVPRMGYDLKSISYDSSRHQNTLDHLSFSTDEAKKLARIYVGVPYKLSLELSVLTKLQSDGMQIVEQILPYFTPDLTFALNVIPELGLLDTIPVVLTGVNCVDLYEGDFEKNRLITWNLSFDMNVNFYGLRRKQSRIEEVIVDLYTGLGTSDLSNPPVFLEEEDNSGRILEESVSADIYPDANVAISEMASDPISVVTEDNLLVDEATANTYLTTGRVARIDVRADAGQDAPESGNVSATSTITEYDGDVIRTRTGDDEEL